MDAIPEGARFYWANTDDYGVLCVDEMEPAEGNETAIERDVVFAADWYPEFTYFYVEAPEVSGNDDEITFDYRATHISVYDDSPAMMVSRNPFVLINEDGYIWRSNPDNWREVR